MNKLIMIAAVGKNGELGYKNGLIWHIKEESEKFKKEFKEFLEKENVDLNDY